MAEPKRKRTAAIVAASAALAAFTALAAVPAAAAAGADAPSSPAEAAFFKGRNVTLIIATGVGASYDFFGRLVARHMGQYIPGQPAIAPQNMPGASGFRAANQLYAVAPKDGTVLATFNNAIAFYQAMRQPGIQYKAQDFAWVGAIPQDTPQLAVWHTSGVKTIDDAKRVEVVMGATGAGGNFAGHPALLNSVLGTKFKIVTGYDGGGALNLAIERGEVQGKANTTWAAFKTITPEWVKEHKIVPLVQFGPVKDPNLPDVPLLTDLARSDEERKMFELVCSTVELGQPFAAPPGIASDRLAVLRAAFEKTVRDTAFQADAAKLAAEVEMKPITGDQVAAIVRRTVETPEALVERVRAAMEVKGAKGGGAD